MKKTITIYVADQGVWGADRPHAVFFKSIKDRNAFVKATDYTRSAGTIKVTEEEYDEYERYWDIR